MFNLKSILIFLLIIKNVKMYNLCIVGATSGLGRELIFQSIASKNSTVIALSNSCKEIYYPCRTNSFTEIKNKNIFRHPNLDTECYWNNIKGINYEHVIFCTSSKPFEKDYSDKIMVKILQDLSPDCKSISLVSAYGVGDSLDKKNLGISIMNYWYLKDVYRAKNKQEEYLNNNFKHIKNKFIYRPKALSYGETKLESISRKELAKNIINKLDNI